MSEPVVSDDLAKALRAAGWVRPVRCKDCICYHPNGGFCDFLADNPGGEVQMEPDDYCSYGSGALDEDAAKDIWWEHYEHRSYDDGSSWGGGE